MSSAHEHEQHDVHHAAEFDQDIDLRGVGKSLIGLAVLIAVSMVLMWWLAVAMKKRQVAQDPPALPLDRANEAVVPPEPRLQANPALELAIVRAEERQHLTSYAWVNQAGGLARIPVARAMEIVAQRGLPKPPLVQPVTLPAPAPAAEAAGGTPSH